MIFFRHLEVFLHQALVKAHWSMANDNEGSKKVEKYVKVRKNFVYGQLILPPPPPPIGLFLCRHQVVWFRQVQVNVYAEWKRLQCHRTGIGKHVYIVHRFSDFKHNFRVFFHTNHLQVELFFSCTNDYFYQKLVVLFFNFNQVNFIFCLWWMPRFNFFSI